MCVSPGSKRREKAVLKSHGVEVAGSGTAVVPYVCTAPSGLPDSYWHVQWSHPAALVLGVLVHAAAQPGASLAMAQAAALEAMQL